MEELAGSSRKRRKIIPEQPCVTTILHLNYDCLRKIFSYLNVRELIVTELVCKIFKGLAKDIYKTYRFLEIDDKILTGHVKFAGLFKISGAEAEKMFRRVGPYLETLKLKDRCIKSSKPLRFVWQYCKNLKAIHLDSIKLTKSDNAIKIASALKNVEIAHIKNCFELNDFSLETMFDLKRLKSLSLTELKGLKIDGRFLVELKDIEELNLTNSPSLVIDSDVFVEFCRSNPQLRILKISLIPWIFDTCLVAISNYLINLECLEVSCTALQHWYVALMDLPKLKDITLRQTTCDISCDIYELITKLAAHDSLEGLKIYFSRLGSLNPNIWTTISSFTKLKRLTIAFANISPNLVLQDLASSELEELDISSTEVTDDDLEMLVKKFKEIRYINVTGCKKLTTKVIPQIMRHLPGRRYKLILVVKMTSISMWKLHDPLKSDLLMLVNNWPEKYNDIYDV